MPKLPLQKGRADVAALTTGIEETLYMHPMQPHPFMWQVFLDFSYMHASLANLEALYRMELGVEASSQDGCSAARVLAPY